MEGEIQMQPKKSFFGRFWWMILAIIICVTVVFVVTKKQAKIGQPNGFSSNSHNNELGQINDDSYQLSRGKCKGTEKNKLGALPMKYEDFSMILPYGLTAGGHVTPIDHQYFSPTVFRSPRDKYEVYAMADATIVDISERQKPEGEVEYRFVFSISCKLYYYYDLVTSLAPDIKAEWQKSQRDINILVKEGQLVGRIGGQTLDFAVWDMDENLGGFVVPEHYAGEVWKIHTVDPLDYYTDDLKKTALTKYARTVEPRSGKIDYDIDGKLIGNWFLEGTGGYVQEGKSQEYWKGHLSIAPDAYDPASTVFSVGDYNGEAKQFGIKGNLPDPASSDQNSGLIKYELVQQDWVDGTGRNWDRMSLSAGLKAKNHNERVEGTALIQMIEARKIQVEIFPGKSASQVAGFTASAKIYER
jgi:hypothetical protein